MKRYTIKDAKNVAKRFLAAVSEFEERERTDEEFRRFVGITGFKETAALRRASMDLTRALAKMRKP
jgi:hypothetical protein